MDLRQVFVANYAGSAIRKGYLLAHEADVNRSYMSTLGKGASYPRLEIIGKLLRPSFRLSLPSY
jgi:hypothetical protein